MDNTQTSDDDPIAWLKSSRENLINNLHYQFGYDEGSDGVYMADPGGVLITRGAFESLVADVRKFFTYHGDHGVDQFNAEIAALREQDWPELLRPQAQVETAIVAQRDRASGSVYLIRAENGLYKIGKAVNVAVRLQSLAAAIPMKWEMVHSFRAANHSTAEWRLHKRFADKREVGEWFRLSREDVAYIQALQDFALDADHGNA